MVDSDGQGQQQLRPGSYPCSFPGESGNDELRCLQVLLVEGSSPVWRSHLELPMRETWLIALIAVTCDLVSALVEQ